MALSDRFRINELVKKGSSVIRRDSSNQIVVQKSNGKEKRPIISKEAPFGSVPIKGKQISPRFKSDLNEVDDSFVQEQTSFDGETSGYIEKPKYNEEELQKAIDVKVDELIKKEKIKKGPFVKQEIYDKLNDRFKTGTDAIEDLRAKLNDALSKISGLESQNLSLQQQLDAALQQRAVAENQNTVVSDRYGSLLADFQNSIIKGTKEAIERVSLTAQVRGLQAQKISLQEQLKLKDQIEEQEEAQQEVAAILASLSGPDNSYDQKGESGWKVPEPHEDPNLFETRQIHFRSNRGGSGWGGLDSLELYNFSEEAEITWSISIKAAGGGHGTPWLGFSKQSGTIPPRSGETPGKIEIDAKKVRNVNSPKGRRKEFTDDITLTIGQETYNIKGIMYRKLRKGGHGN